MGGKLADASASKRACALESAARCESRFCACHHAACMRIAMATHDRPADVIAESSDVSDRRQRSEGRGLTCRSALTRHSTRSTANAMVLAQKSQDCRPVHWDNLPSSFNVVQVKRSCQESLRKRVDKPRSKREALADISTWRTDRWARWKPVEATQARESDHQSCDLRATQNCG